MALVTMLGFMALSPNRNTPQAGPEGPAQRLSWMVSTHQISKQFSRQFGERGLNILYTRSFFLRPPVKPSAIASKCKIFRQTACSAYRLTQRFGARRRAQMAGSPA